MAAAGPGLPSESNSPDLDFGPLAAPADPFWLEAIKHQGISAYNPNPQSYQVFRNVRDFGAKGDGITDDAEAIKTYLVSQSLKAYYYTQLIGDPKNPPTLLAASSFNDLAVIDADPYIPGGNGAQWYQNQNNFFRSVRNFVIDVRRVPATMSQGTGIHWQVAQATSLMNIRVEMSTAPDTAHQGEYFEFISCIWMENGSGGLMSDLVFNGGKFGIWVGNQQFTVRNITINNAADGCDGGWTFQGVFINNCQIGFDLLNGLGAEAIIDAVVRDTPIFVRSGSPNDGTLTTSLVLSNIQLNNVPTAVASAEGTMILSGGDDMDHRLGQIPSPHKPAVLLDSAGRIFGKPHPQYANYHISQFVSVRDEGATGDGKTDDTEAIKRALGKCVGHKILFFDAGTYIVTSTITIPAGSRIVGEAWSGISGSGPAFQDQDNPQVVVRVGEAGSQGVIEITDIIFSTVGPAAGAIVVEWNIKETTQGSAGAWDTHIRLGGSAGTNLEAATCLPGSDPSGCMAAFMALHLTPGSTAYLEGTWVWLADHWLDGDGDSKLSIYSGRGILSESQGPVWLIGTTCKYSMGSTLNTAKVFTAEHHVMYQYQLLNARNHYMGLIQTETPYFQPDSSLAIPAPFKTMTQYGDPQFPPEISMAWAVIVKSSSDILVFGAGLYSFYNNYSQACLATRNCQDHIVNITDSAVDIFSLVTIGSQFQVSVNGGGVVDQKDNMNGFASTVTVWRSENVVLFGSADSPSLIFFLSLRLAPPPPSSCSRSGSGAESVSNLQTVASAPTALLSACALRHAHATEPPRKRIPPVLTHRHAQGLVDGAWPLVRHGAHAPVDTRRAGSPKTTTRSPNMHPPSFRHEALTAPQQCRILAALLSHSPHLRTPVPDTNPPRERPFPVSQHFSDPGSTSSYATSNRPFSPFSRLRVFPGTCLFPAASRRRHTSPASATLSFFAASTERRRLVVPKHQYSRPQSPQVLRTVVEGAPPRTGVRRAPSRALLKKHRVRAAYKCALLHCQILRV
ncbi:pectin lyase fold/virulence factor [Mycena rebaudengoi]|nr:pectin lyase fold/virulence factor [Mycena rebaudengoi]